MFSGLYSCAPTHIVSEGRGTYLYLDITLSLQQLSEEVRAN